MSMPSVTYDAIANKLAVQAKPAALLGTNTTAAGSGVEPGIGSFDPTQVWSVLNGTAFSRMLGWNDPGYDYANFTTSVLSAVQNVYGLGSYIWIDTVAKSTGLNTYLAVGPDGITFWTPPADPSITPGTPYAPILGTPGSSTRWQWDGIMDHNTYSVPFSYLNSPNQPFSATYRLYVGDAAGNELLVDKKGTPVSSAATTTTWNWKGPAFVFTSQTGIPSGTALESDVYTVTGIPNDNKTDPPSPVPSAISITGGEYTISTDGGVTWGGWTATTGMVFNTYKVKVRQSSAAGPGVTTTATLAIPGVPGPGEFRITTTTLPEVAWPVKIQDGFAQPSLAYAYWIAPDMVEPNNAVIMIRDGILADETLRFSADRNITVTLQGGYDPTFTTQNGVTIIRGAQNIFTVKQGKVIVDKVYIRSTVPL